MEGVTTHSSVHDLYTTYAHAYIRLMYAYTCPNFIFERH